MIRKTLAIAALIAAFAFGGIDAVAMTQGAQPATSQSQSKTLPPKSQGNNMKGKGVKKRVRKHFKRKRRVRKHRGAKSPK